MSFPIRCPGCEASLNVAENLIGKTIKCNKCGEMVTVKAPATARAAAPARATRPAVVVEDDDDSIVPAKAPRRRNVDDDGPPIKASRRRDEDEDDDFDDRPRKRSAKADAAGGKSKAPLLVGGLAALLLLGGGTVGAYFAFFDKKPETTQNTGTTTPPPPSNAGGPSGNENPPDTETKTPAEAPEKKNDPPVNTKTSAPTTITTPTTPAISSQIPPSTSVEYNNKIMSGILDEITLAKVKHATVMIEVESPGKHSTGSGWFGLEPGIIFTNSHVLHMKAPGSPPPAKITVYVDSGERGQTPGVKQRDIPHNRIKIIGVDRDNDLAILQILGEKDLPEPLKVRTSDAFRETQKVTTFGFPRGYDTGTIAGGGENQPVVSVRPSAIVAKRYDRFGTLRLIQIEGGVNQGNSGGPIVDAEGQVVAVSVLGIPDRNGGSLTSLVFGVATEHIFGILSGRLDEIEYEQPYLDGEKVKVPVKATVIDPLGRFKSAGIGVWIGDHSTQYRPPGSTRTGMLPSDKNFTKVDLKYDSVKKIATGELVFDQLPTGLAYWVQPCYSNAKTPLFWNPGITLPNSGPPVERVATNLRVNLRTGTQRPITLTRETSREEFFEGQGQAKSERALLKTLIKGHERLLDPDRNDQRSAARLRITYDDIDVKEVSDGQEHPAMPPQFMVLLKQGINKVEAFGYLDRRGELYNVVTNTLASDNPTIKAVVPLFSNDVLGALRECSIPMPNKEVHPLESWPSTRTVTHTESYFSLLGQDSPNPARPAGRGPTILAKTKEYKYIQNITFTYLGTRTRGGKKEAVVKVEGKTTAAAGQPKESATGLIKGHAFVDINTGIVIEADIEEELDLDASEQGYKKKLSSIDKCKIIRGAQTN